MGQVWPRTGSQRGRAAAWDGGLLHGMEPGMEEGADGQEGAGLGQAFKGSRPPCLHAFMILPRPPRPPVSPPWFLPLKPEEQLVQVEETGAVDADVGVVFTVAVTKGGQSLV